MYTTLPPSLPVKIEKGFRKDVFEVRGDLGMLKY